MEGLGFGLEKVGLGLEVNKKERILVDELHNTSVKGMITKRIGRWRCICAYAAL